MIARLNAKYKRLTVDENGAIDITFEVAPKHRYSVKNEVVELKKHEWLQLKIDKVKKSRTLDQNALMWALLTEYANGLNANRTGGETPEGLYYKVLEKYGIAVFLDAVTDAEEILNKNFRVVKKIDVCEVGGVEFTKFKCYFGSSTYDTKQMGNLIDGILDELTQAGISTAETRYLEEEYRNGKINFTG